MSDKIIFTNGCFDVLHVGHIKLLEYCKSLGKVVVGLNSDESVKRLKGKNRPINNEKDRKFLLESLRFVDYVVIFSEDTPINLINDIKPNIIVKGGDYSTKEVVGHKMAEVKIFDFINGYSSTKAITDISDRG